MGNDIGAEADGCDLGDRRLNARYRLLLERLGDQPQLSIPAACRGKAEVEAAYRFFDHPRITPARLLAPHQAATRRRMAAVSWAPATSTITTDAISARPNNAARIGRRRCMGL